MAVLAVAGVMALTGSGCVGSDTSTDNTIDSATDSATSPSADADRSETGDRDSTAVRVFGAASLTDAFQDLETAFEAEHPAFDLELNLAGSSGLREQILDGAPVDVFASASEAIMDQVVTELSGRDAVVEEPRAFATNQLTIAVPAGNPASVTGLQDFARSELFLGLCAEPVPCGELADRALEAAGIEPSVDTRESDVRALLNKVETGELDAGIVYRTDVLASGSVEAIDVPTTIDAASTYPISVLGQGDSIEGGRAFVVFLFGEAGQGILADHGFGAP